MSDQITGPQFVALDWGGIGGTLGGLVAVGLIVVQAFQKNKIDALATAQENLKLKQEQIDMLQKKAEGAETEAAALKVKVAEQQEDIKELRSMVMLEKIPAPLQAVLDSIVGMQKSLLEMQSKIVDTLDMVRKLVQAETGEVEQPSRKR